MTPDDSSLDKTLIQAYISADYHVFHQPEFTLKINQFSQKLLTLYHNYHCQSAALITANNPESQTTSEQQNHRSNQQLQQDLIKHSAICIDAAGRDPSGHWPDEPSFLVLGITQKKAISLAKKYRQNAFLWCDQAAVPQLVLIK